MAKKVTKKFSLHGPVQIPGDKSVSHRALMLSALGEGSSTILNILDGEDVRSTAECLENLGVSIDWHNRDVLVEGVGLHGLKQPNNDLDAGNSGTTIRLLSGILAAQPFVSTMTGDASLKKRPMSRIIRPLEAMGISIRSSDGCAPLVIQGQEPTAIHYHSPVASAQIKSCVLLAGLFADGMTTVTEPAKSRDHTERILPCFGVPVHSDGLSVSVSGPAQLKGTTIQVPGDISSAAFFLVAGSIVPESEIVLKNCGINPSRTGILDILTGMGANLNLEQHRIENGEPIADIRVTSSQLKGTVIEGDMIPRVIDEIPILAVAATRAQGETIVRDAAELRVKETDRIDAVVTNLRAMGVQIEAMNDGFRINGPQDLNGTNLDSFNDHRIAMAFAVAGLVARGETIIEKAECVDISYPGYFEVLERLQVDKS